MFNVNARVLVNSTHYGNVVGTYCSPQEDTWGYVVELDEGFWSEDHTMFIRLVVSHPDNLRKP
jgi:hypothetical protein